MAVPRVFVSSTCYDLGQVRDNLISFIKSFYFEPVLSENGDVFYHPDLHTHESCINEVGSCELFILIIGGRFGGNYVYDKKKSIVNAEYVAARENNIPVFTFVKREVYEDHRLFQKNKHLKDVIDHIIFPSIEKQEYAKNIFQFIDEVRLSKVNNGLIYFEFARDIEEWLGKQWAGMFCDFLKKRKQQKEYEVTKNLLNQLTIATEKTEEIVKSLYLHIDEKTAENAINSINEEVEAKQFFEVVKSKLELDHFTIIDMTDITNLKAEDTWIDFLSKFNNLLLEVNCDVHTSENSTKCQDIIWNSNNMIGFGVGGEINKQEQDEVKNLEKMYNSYKKLDEKDKVRILSNYVQLISGVE